MKQMIFIMIVSVTIIGFIAKNTAGNEIAREHVIVLVDLSDSALHVQNKLFARKAAQYIGSIIENLQLGTTIEIRTFGDYERSSNILSFSFMLSRKKGQRPADIKRNIELFVGNLPKLINEGKLVLQETTSIIGELKIIAERINKTRKTKIIVLSDMLEYSAEANCYKLIKSKNGRLPEVTEKIFENLDVIALGAGYGCQNSTENDRLKAMWIAWFEKAGAKEFRYLSDF